MASITADTAWLSDQRDSILAEAAARAGCDDFGPPDFEEGLGRLLASIDAEARLPEQGRVAARALILTHLVSRLRSIQGFKAHPEAMERPIVRPLIITGIVRSGTTALHKLLSMDPQFQGTEHWLTFYPQPRPPRAQWLANADYRTAATALDEMTAIATEMVDDHDMAVDGVEETLYLLTQTLCSNMYCSLFEIPGYDAWYRATDDTFSYARFADNLRLIGANTPDRTWLLKNPTDTWSMRQVLNVFPDAMIVQTHRDPLQSIPSVVNLLRGGYRVYRGDDSDMRYPMARETEFWAQAMERADQVKATIPGRSVDVFFRDFVTDQMGVVRRIYDHFGLYLSGEAEAAMIDWLRRNPRRSTTMQRFTPEDFGLPTDTLLERFRPYRERYGFA